MNYDSHIDEKIKKLMEKKTQHTVFREKAKKEVLKRINRRNTPFRRFMEKELEISISPVLAAIALLIAISLYTIYPCFKITESDVRENAVYIFNLSGGRANENQN